jgi:amidase/aspartyl-tRNA(Asn)/glutamyl-tRNA(Gln) amidotransferase subunit A
MAIRELAQLSLAELMRAYASAGLSPVEVMRETLDHAEAVNPAINALFCFRPEQALAGAQASEARWRRGEPLGLLDGVPMTVKDSVAMIGWPYHHGIKGNADIPPSNYDSPPAMALMATGAPVFAKTAMPDCGLMASGLSSLFGVTRNPWGLKWNTGGSSAGAGASLAAGVGFVSIGTDIAGSVRLPAGHCGLASLKPTHGRVAHLPADFMRMAGPMGRRVEDVARLLTVLCRFDERDTWAFPDEGTPYHQRLGRDLKGLRIGVLTDIGFGPEVEAPVREAVETAGRLLADADAAVEPFVSPFDWDAYAPMDYFFQTRGLVEIENLPPHGPDGLNPYVRDWALKAKEYRATDLYRALAAITRMKAQLLAAFEPYDYLIAPTLPMVNFPAEEPGPDRAMPLAHTVYTAPFNQTGQPAGTINMGFDGRGLPIGVQIVGHRCDDLGVLQIAKALEDMRGFAMDWPLQPRA